jgi:hypothetical protein
MGTGLRVALVVIDRHAAGHPQSTDPVDLFWQIEELKARYGHQGFVSI